MILGKIKDIKRYLHIHPNLDEAILFLDRENLSAYSTGSYPIKEKDVFMNRFDYETIAREQGFWEGHKEYLDIHIVVEGEELLGYADESDLKVIQPYNQEEDFIKYDGKESLFYTMKAGDFAIVFPEDIHMPKIMKNQPDSVKKAVIKVRVS